MLPVPFRIGLVGIGLTGVDLSSEILEVGLHDERDPHLSAVILKFNRRLKLLFFFYTLPTFHTLPYFIGIGRKTRTAEELSVRRHLDLHHIATFRLVFLQLFLRIVIGQLPVADIDLMSVFCKLGSYNPREILDPLVMKAFDMEQAHVSVSLRICDFQRIYITLFAPVNVYGDSFQRLESHDVLERYRERHTREFHLVFERCVVG